MAETLCIAAATFSGVGLTLIGLWVRMKISVIDAAHRDCLQRLARLEGILDRYRERDSS